MEAVSTQGDFVRPLLDASNERSEREGSKGLVILSEAKDHLATLDPLEMILRFAQDDSSEGCSVEARPHSLVCPSPLPLSPQAGRGVPVNIEEKEREQ